MKPFLPGRLFQWPEALPSTEVMASCLDCLYCFAVCPGGAIKADGELGFYAEQMRRYEKLIKKEC